MRTHKKITIPGLIMLLVMAVFATGCEQSAPLSIDPVELETPFTFAPASGHPGQTVAISGNGLANVERVSFSTREARILSKTNEEIRVEIPVGALTGRIKLIRPNSVTSSITEFRVDPVPVPNIIGFTPAIVGRNQAVTITGNLLDQVDSVHVGTLRATITGQTATSINITTPAAMVSAPIRLYYDFLTEFGFIQVREAVSATQLSLALPVINSITPDIGTLDVGTIVTIEGTMMDAVTLVHFGTINAPFTIVSPTSLTTTVPAGATTGRIVLTVPDGTAQSSSDFRVNLPVISNFFPQKGSEIVGGTRDITLTGTGFDRVTEARLGATAVTILAQTATNITVRIGGSQTGPINLVTANGIVGTGIPFIITGDFWLVDFDRTFSPQRFTSSGWDQVNATVQALTSVPSGGARGNFGSTTATLGGGDVWPRFWIRGDGGGTAFPGTTAAHAAPDRFLLYTSSSQGVFLEFDLNLGRVPAEMVDANGNVRVKLAIAAAAGDSPWGYAAMLTVPADPNTWTSYRINTHTMGGGGTDVVIFSTTAPPLGTARWNPSRNRLFGFIFVDARNNAALAGQQLILNVDNVRFRIE